MRLPCQRGLQRLSCLLRGHRDLAPAGTYAEVLEGNIERELHYCGSCGGPVWVSSARDHQPALRWDETGDHAGN